MKHDYSKYTFQSKLELVNRYAEVLTELANLNVELSDLLQDEHRTRYQTWQSSTEQTINGRDRDATIATVDITTEIHKVRGDIMAFKSEKELIEFLVSEKVHL